MENETTHQSTSQSTIPGQQQQFRKHVSVPSSEGLRVDKVILIERPVSEVYSFWHQLENLPRFMRHVESVTVSDDLHSHWVVKTVGEKTLDWDAEIIEQRDNEMISWRSAPGADVDNAGSVWFTPTQDGQSTFLRVSISYSPPGGKPAAYMAKLFGRDAASEIDEDLQRLKTLIETGHLPLEDTARTWQDRAAEVTRRAAAQADQYVRKNPWTFLASVAVVGVVTGFLLGRMCGSSRSDED